MFDFFSNLVALIMNPISLVVFLLVMKYIFRKSGKKENGQWGPDIRAGGYRRDGRFQACVSRKPVLAGVEGLM